MKTVIWYWAGRQRVALLVLLLALTRPGFAQAQTCMLVPVPLAERVGLASLIVEAAVGTQETQAANGHLYTLSALTVYKVFRGPVPALLRVAEAGGTLGLQREVVSTSVGLAPGQQGLFMLEPNPELPGSYRLVAGPQGLVRYDLAARSASEPFGRYASIAGELYPKVEALTGQAYRTLQNNAALQGSTARRPQAQPAISGFSPASLAAGRGDVLTINGANFGATQGNGHVDFPNANNGGSSFVSANASDYVLWSDTQIQVRVPSVDIATGAPAGSGNFRVVNGISETGTSPGSLLVVYALSNLSSGSNTLRVQVINDDARGGYTLQFSPSFTAVAGAPEAFQRALTTWNCAAQLRRFISNTPAPEATTSDGANAVRFGTLSAGVLGVANSYYSGCPEGGTTRFSLTETDFTFAPTPSSGTTWQFGPVAPNASQFDFESVALHEEGHGAQLTHIIDGAAVMHYSIANGQQKRTLRTASDVAGANDVFAYSQAATCGFAAPVAGPSCALPVELVSFEARYEPGRGTVLAWATASEQGSAYFAVEARDEYDAAGWREVLRQPAAGNSAGPLRYSALDARLLGGRRYYRLRQADLDGRTEFSPLVLVTGQENSLTLYPNPSPGRVQISGLATAGYLRCYDLAGREVARQELPVGPGEIDLRALPPGLYQLEWTDGTHRQRTRLQKL